jgi:hypothetical protein
MNALFQTSDSQSRRFAQTNSQECQFLKVARRKTGCGLTKLNALINQP